MMGHYGYCGVSSLIVAFWKTKGGDGGGEWCTRILQKIFLNIISTGVVGLTVFHLKC